MLSLFIKLSKNDTLALPTQMDLYDPYMVPTLFPRGIIIFQGVLTKFNYSTKFSHLEKIADLMKDLKYEHQSIFPLLGGSNLILGIGMEN